MLFVLVQAWQTRFFLNEDTVSYLDHGDAFFRLDWGNAISGYWGPLYSILLGASIHLVRPGPHAEPLVVHAVNFGLFLFALAGFGFFLRTLLDAHPLRDQGPHLRRAVTAIGYALFAWSCLRLIPQSLSTPDMGVAALVYFAAGLLVRIRGGGAARGTFALLGLVLGVAYLTKSVMFVLAWVFLMVAWWADAKTRGRGSRTAIALGTFAVVSALLVVPLSLSKGSLTMGESGRLGYAWFVNGVPRPPYWQGEDPRHGSPLHPPRLVEASPRVYEFATPLAGTYPPWFEPPHWYRGLQVRFDLRRQAAALVREVRSAGRMLLLDNGAFVGPILALWAFGALPWWPDWRSGGKRVLAGWRDQYHLFIPGVAAPALYALVLVQPRYVAPFLLLVLVAMFAGTPVDRARQREFARCTWCLVGMFWVLLGLELLQNPYSDADRAEHARVAEQLQGMGFEQRSPFAHVGNSHTAYWARLGRFRIVTEVPRHDAASFWADAEAQQRALNAFAASGARAVVVQPPRSPGAGWIEIPATRYYVRFLELAPAFPNKET